MVANEELNILTIHFEPQKRRQLDNLFKKRTNVRTQGVLYDNCV